MNEDSLKFIQVNSPYGGFLQSEYWRKFQESVGRKTYNISASDESGKILAFANIIEHTLPVAGDYFYVPRGLVGRVQNSKFKIQNYNAKYKSFLSDLINLAKTNNTGWIRIEPADEQLLSLIKNNLPQGYGIKRSSVDMQPREILVMDISRSEEEILAEMKQKTRYNIRLAEKRGVKVSSIMYKVSCIKYFDEFLRLVKITAKRDKIISHPENYYRKMFEIIPPEILKLYIAEYEGKIISANLVLFFGKTATYMHGASDNIHRDVMAPYLLQWVVIKDAKKAGCEKYDLGGIKTQPHPSPLLIKERGNSWAGITKFKTGFAPDVMPIRFPGSYDIILKPAKYNLYRALQKLKRFF